MKGLTSPDSFQKTASGNVSRKPMFKLTVTRNQLNYRGNIYKQRWRRIWMKPHIADLRYKASRASDIDLKNCTAKVNEKAHIQENERKHIHIQGRTDKKGIRKILNCRP
jgi:hypothetical protein